MKIIHSIILVFILFLTFNGFSQKENIFEYRREFYGGANFNTNGGAIGGLMFKYSWHRNKNIYNYLGLEITNVKHPKEVRLASFKTGNSFIAWKQNALIPIRIQYGREIILFNSDPNGGVQINLNLVGGPTIGLLKPYYIIYGNDPNTAKKEAFDPNTHTNLNFVHGTGGPFDGLSDLQFKPGINIKTSLSFYFTKFGNNITGIETGFLLEMYPEEIVIIPFSDNTNIFTSAFINIFFGVRK